MMTEPDRHSPSDRLDRSWDENARAWTAAVREGGIESRRVATDRAIVEAVARLAPGRVLDVGCGEGWLCRALGEKGIECIGVDGSTELVGAARAADPDGDYRLLRYADFHRLAELAATRPFDAAVCNFALLHEEVGPILDAVRAALRPGGALLIQTVHPWAAGADAGYADGWRTEEFSWSGHPFPEAMPWYFRTLESWMGALRESGFALDALAEPRHPESGRPLSLVLSAVRP